MECQQIEGPHIVKDKLEVCLEVFSWKITFHKDQMEVYEWEWKYLNLVNFYPEFHYCWTSNSWPLGCPNFATKVWLMLPFGDFTVETLFMN